MKVYGLDENGIELIEDVLDTDQALPVAIGLLEHLADTPDELERELLHWYRSEAEVATKEPGNLFVVVQQVLRKLASPVD